MREAIIDGGIVVNIVVVDGLSDGAVDAGSAKIGDTWDGDAFTPAAVVQPVPESVSRIQAVFALNAAGLLTAVTNYMADPGTDPLHKLAWEHGNNFKRQGSIIAAAGTALGMTDTQVDDLFRAADQVDV